MKPPRTLGVIACIAATAAGCAAAPPLPQVDAWLASGRPAPPPQDACPAVTDLDLAAMARGRPAPSDGPPVEPVFQTTLPDAVEAMIPADAPVVIRALLPPGGLYNSEIRSAVWKGPDGVWMVWRQSKDFSAPPSPPPPPPPPRDSEYYSAWEAAFGNMPQRPQTDDERWPPVTGPLGRRQAERLEAALNDPCRAWDPDFYPYEVPLRRPIDGWGEFKLCPPDGGSYIVDITEPGRARRSIGAACINDTPTFQIITVAAYAHPDA